MFDAVDVIILVVNIDGKKLYLSTIRAVGYLVTARKRLLVEAGLMSSFPKG